MEFLRSLLRRRFARAQVATPWNVGCFLGLCLSWLVIASFVVVFRGVVQYDSPKRWVATDLFFSGVQEILFGQRIPTAEWNYVFVPWEQILKLASRHFIFGEETKIMIVNTVWIVQSINQLVILAFYPRNLYQSWKACLKYIRASV